TGNDGAHAFQIAPLVPEHILEEIDCAVPGRFGPNLRAAVLQPLTGEHAGEMVGDALVLPEHVADLASAHTDVACRNVHIGADVAVEFGHEALAKAHHLAVGLALGVEVRAALASAHRQAGERILERLLESEKLEHALINARMEAKPALVGPDRVVVLDPATTLDSHIASIVLPADTKRYDAVGLCDAAQNLRRLVGLLVRDEAED